MKELLKALAAAKKEIAPIAKDSTNPFYKSKYFDINQILESVEPVLFNHGLLVMQPVKEGRVSTILFHVESGESIESDIDLPNITDPQKLGMAITYYRRYTIQSLLALQAEDDDGNTAKKEVENTEAKKEEPVWLTKAQYDKAMLADAKGITATLNTFGKQGYAMKSEYRINLTAKLKELK